VVGSGVGWDGSLGDARGRQPRAGGRQGVGAGKGGEEGSSRRTMRRVKSRAGWACPARKPIFLLLISVPVA